MSNNVILICIDGMAAYNLKNKRLKMPHLQYLIEQGTKAAGVRGAYPSSTWAMNTSIITGTFPKKHGVLGNRVIDQRDNNVKEFFGDRDFNKKDVHVPTLHDIAYKNNRSTASICWPLTRGSNTLTYNIPEFYEQALFEKYVDKDWWQELIDAGLPLEKYGTWSSDYNRGHMQDWLSTEIAKHLIEKHQPNLLTIHYLLADTMQHLYGIGSDEALWALSYLDERIGELRKQLHEAGLEKKTDIFIVSDHGFLEVDQKVNVHVLFEKQGWLHKENLEKNDVMVTSNGGAGYIRIVNKDKVSVKDVITLLEKTEGIKAVYVSEQFPSLGLPESERHHLQADVIVECEEGYYIDFKSDANAVIERSKIKGMHGYHPDNEKMNGIFVAYGPNIYQGKEIPEISIVDIAPTIAKQMNVSLPDADGKVLADVFNLDKERQ